MFGGVVRPDGQEGVHWSVGGPDCSEAKRPQSFHGLFLTSDLTTLLTDITVRETQSIGSHDDNCSLPPSGMISRSYYYYPLI